MREIPSHTLYVHSDQDSDMFIDNTIPFQVGFSSERLVMSYLVDIDFSSRDFETTRKIGVSLRKNSGRVDNIPREEEIR